MTLESASFNLRAAIEDVLRLVCPKARQRGLAVLLDYGTGLSEWFVGDQQRLRQVFINLVGNAVKFTLEGSVVVRVRGRAHGKRMALEITVEDTGIGIASENLSRIFCEFARVEGEGARRFEGSGLGLAISRRLVEMMEGELGVESELGIGTAFAIRLSLPVAQAETPTDRRSPAPAHPAGLSSLGRALTVLLVEDNRTNQIVVGKMLASEPITLRIARNGIEAIALFRDVAPDVVLMDLCMPEMDGLAATSALRRIEAEEGIPRTPVIALTAYAGEEHHQRCLEQGMDYYLSKPLQKAALIAAIRTQAEAEQSPPRRQAGGAS